MTQPYMMEIIIYIILLRVSYSGILYSTVDRLLSECYVALSHFRHNAQTTYDSYLDSFAYQAEPKILTDFEKKSL